MYHFMYGPGWDEGLLRPLVVCNHEDAACQHFEHHDVAYAAVSRAPLADFRSFKKRMG